MFQVIDLPDANVRISGNVLARDMSYEDFMTHDEWTHAEWVDGVAIQMPGIDEKHDGLTGWLRILFTIFLERAGGGRIFQDPALMRLKSVPSSRAPDIQVILPEHFSYIKRKEVAGPADLVIEIISDGSRRTDRVDKFREYELGGVPEYWILDPTYQLPEFYQRTPEGVFEQIHPDEQSIYRSMSLKGLALHVQWLWREPLPSVTEMLAFVDAMLV